MLKLIQISIPIISIFLLTNITKGQSKAISEKEHQHQHTSIKAITPINNDYFMHSWQIATTDINKNIQCIVFPTENCASGSFALKQSFLNTFKAVISNSSNGHIHSISLLSLTESSNLLNADFAGYTEWRINENGYTNISITGMSIHGFGFIYMIIKEKEQASKSETINTIRSLFALD